MENTFLSLKPLQRFQRICVILQEIAKNLSKNKVDFITLVYGSASYGFKKSTYGTFGDIDMILIVQRTTPVAHLIDQVEKAFSTKLQVNISHLQKMIDGMWDMCRMYGETHGIKIGFRIMCIDSFLQSSGSTTSTAVVRNVATLGHSRIVTDVEWSFKHWRYVPITLPHQYLEVKNEQLLLVNHHTFSMGKRNLGALGRKLLASTVLYDPRNVAEVALLNIFKQVVAESLRYDPSRKDEQITESIYRIERFSQLFKETTLHRIALARALL